AYTLQPPIVVGPGNHMPLAGMTRSFYVSCLADACVRGRSEVVDVEDLSVLDVQAAQRSSINNEVEFDSTVFHAAGETISVIVSEHAADTTEVAEAFTLLGA